LIFCGSWVRKELRLPNVEEGALILEADIEPEYGDVLIT